MIAPLLQIKQPRLQKYFAALVTENVRAPIHQRLKFLASLDAKLKSPKEEEAMLRKLFTHRNQLIHSSLLHRELAYLPADWSDWGEMEFEKLPKRGSLEYKGWSTDLFEMAFLYYEAARKLIERYESVQLIEDDESKP